MSSEARKVLTLLKRGIRVALDFDGRHLRALRRLGYIKAARRAGNYVEITARGRKALA